MSADVHTAIREALHGNEITVADLRYPELRRPAHRRTRQALAIAGAMAAVVVLAVALAITVGGRGEDPAAGPSGSLAGVVGYRWQVIRLTDPYGSLPVSGALHAQIDFTRDGYVLGNDTMNALQANYRITARGYTVRNAVSSLVGSTGVSPQRKRTVAAVDAMFFTVSSKPGGLRPPGGEVVVSVHGDTLILNRASFTLALRRAGTQPDFFAQTVSPTPTKTS